MLTDGRPAIMRIEVGSTLVIAVGVPLPDVDGAYFDFVSFDDVENTLRSVGLALVFAAAITTLLGMVLGAVSASRAVRPLAIASQAAQAIAGVRLETRLEPTDDPDLDALT